MTIGSGESGKFLDLDLATDSYANECSGMVKWGEEIFFNENGESMLENGVYNVSFDFCVKGVSVRNSCFTIFTNHEPVRDQDYRLPWDPQGVWSNYVVSLEQETSYFNMIMALNAPLKETVDEDGRLSYSIDYTDAFVMAKDKWYTVQAKVNVNDRIVESSMMNKENFEVVASGTMTVPETDANGDDISMYAQGMYVITGRYQSEFYIDNIKISYESQYDHANIPTVALTRIGKNADDELDLNLRGYTVSFLDGETLHFEGTDGQTVEVNYADCAGSYVYETTQSGTIKAYTTYGTYTSEMVEVEVDCTPCVLPAPTVSLISVGEGFLKKYNLTVSNADVPLCPALSLSYEFKGADGVILSASKLDSGAEVEIPAEGVLTVTTEAAGYQSTSVSVNNDIEYVIKKEYDFARMSKEELAGAGFTNWQVLNTNIMSGFSNWTSRRRLFYWDATTAFVNDEGETEYEAAYPFGFISEDNTTNVIEYCELNAEDNTAESKHFDGIEVFVGHNLCALYRIGVYNNESQWGANKYIYVPGLEATDVVVANKISSYGGNSNHPVVATAEEYYAQLGGEDFTYLPQEGTVHNEFGELVGSGTYSVNVDVYRIDTACTRLTIYSQKSGNVGVEAVGAVENNDPWYYTIDGLRVAEPTRPGLYIHQGRKIIVRQ